MLQKKIVLSTYCVCLYGLLSIPTIVEAKDTLTVEQAMFKCKTTYPSQFESKKRLACFDSITTPAIETVAKNALINGEVNSATANGGLALDESLADKNIPKAEVAVAIVKPSAELSYLEKKMAFNVSR